jgi:phage terminase small subunit
VPELRVQARRFADAWAPAAAVAVADVAAARAAGYAGDEASLRVTGARLRRDPRVRARIEQRLGRSLDELLAAARASAAPAVEPKPGLVKGRGRGTATERIEIAMSIARSRKVDPADRLDAVQLAAELEGELHRAKGRPATLPLPMPVAPPTAHRAPPRLELVVNDADAARIR